MDASPNKPSKGILTKKLGPLPTWGWMIVGIGVAVVIASVNGQRKKDKDAAEAADKMNTGDGGYGGMTDYGRDSQIFIGGSQRPPVIFQSYNTQTQLPPMGGRPFPPSAPSPAQPCPPGQGQWVTIPGRKGSPCAPGDNPLARFARELLGSADLWRSIWEAPENASLRARRKAPVRLQGGDRVYIPCLTPAGAPCPPGAPAGACPPGTPPPPPPPHIPAPPPPRTPGGHHPMPGRSGSRRHRR